jgi:hypothetical protein
MLGEKPTCGNIGSKRRNTMKDSTLNIEKLVADFVQAVDHIDSPSEKFPTFIVSMAECWASIDGKTEAFLKGKQGVRSEGDLEFVYDAYVVDAEELFKRLIKRYEKEERTGL